MLGCVPAILPSGGLHKLVLLLVRQGRHFRRLGFATYCRTAQFTGVQAGVNCWRATASEASCDHTCILSHTQDTIDRSARKGHHCNTPVEEAVAEAAFAFARSDAAKASCNPHDDHASRKYDGKCHQLNQRGFISIVVHRRHLLLPTLMRVMTDARAFAYN